MNYIANVLWKHFLHYDYCTFTLEDVIKSELEKVTPFSSA